MVNAGSSGSGAGSRPRPTPGPSGPALAGRVGASRADAGSARRAGDRPATRLLFINQYYWPDHASTAQHLTDLAESLAAEGHECHVLCAQGRYQPGTPRPPGLRGP